MKIENNTNMQPTAQDCSINLQQDKFFNKLTDELKTLQTQLFEVEKKVNARDTVIDTLDLSTQSLSVGESTETKDLYVNNNASIQGELSANKATIDTLTVLNDFITKLLHVTDLFANTADIEEADIRSAIIDVLKIKQAILRYDTNQEIVSFPSENVTQIGDIANSILLAGLERPTWNGETLALTSDLVKGLTPKYLGILENETELPQIANVGDFYLIKEVVRGKEKGLGSAIYGINKTWEVTLYYELLNYFNKDEINQLFDEELIDDIQRETDIIKGNTPVQVVANGCVMKRDDGTSDRLATAVDAFMLSGPEGMDNIARSSSLDDLVICGQYSADDGLAVTITEKPNGEVGAFDIAVGQFSGSKQDIYQLYTGKASQKNYFRIGANKEFNGWNEIAYANGETPVEIAKRLATNGAIDSFNLPNNYGNKIVTYSGNAVDSPAPTSNGQAMTFSKGGSEQAIIAFDNSKNDMYFKTQFGTWNKWKKIATLDSFYDLIYPRGSYYWTSDETFNPNEIFGGTWEQVKDKMIMAKGTSFTADGGSDTRAFTLSTANLPSHSHKFTPQGNTTGGLSLNVPFFAQREPNRIVAKNYLSKRMTERDFGVGTDGTSSVTQGYSVNLDHAHSLIGARTDTENTGSGTSMNLMPPYEVAYCWKRTN